ncbi:MAG TPA: carotenoid biosynthesis protein [Blastocatellia bacterium]|nr:carotenoid biosynthesis protein [Blastocatellia bacterium]
MAGIIDQSYLGGPPEERESADDRNNTAANLFLWLLLALYTGARLVQLFPDNVPVGVIAAMHIIPVTVFVLAHGARLYRWRGILIFVGLELIVGNCFENLSVRTGFPFGHYYFTDLMGPKILAVPIFLGLAYVGMGYLSWILARIILGDMRPLVTGSRVVTLPLVAAFIMVGWDMSQEPIWGTVLHLWIWKQGGAYFGVPVSNFFGWYLTVYVFYQLFALYLWKRAANISPVESGHIRFAVLFYAVSAAGNTLLAIPRTDPQMVSDATGAQWRVSDIIGACTMISIFVMGAFAVLAWVRLAEQKPGRRTLS